MTAQTIEKTEKEAKAIYYSRFEGFTRYNGEELGSLYNHPKYGDDFKTISRELETIFAQAHDLFAEESQSTVKNADLPRVAVEKVYAALEALGSSQKLYNIKIDTDTHVLVFSDLLETIEVRAEAGNARNKTFMKETLPNVTVAAIANSLDI